ncbi:MAG TPA: hypothetical protein DGL25_02465, partial [Dehalococcoidia bacterium]|nr:hypothetical protein [Dehalococcoidia bacterium]
AEVEEVAHAVLATRVSGQAVTGLLIEEALSVDRECYLGIVFDGRSRGPAAVASLSGGVDIERAEAGVVRVPLSSLAPTQDFRLKEAISLLGLPSDEMLELTNVLGHLWRLFIQRDLLLAEINPLARTAAGHWVALDARVELDDDALFRQTQTLEDLDIDPSTRSDREASELELEAARIDRSDHRGVAGRVVQFDGSLALLIGGGGASLTAFDAVRACGGQPANYCEIGGNPSVRKVALLTRLLLDQPGIQSIAVIMNVVNNTRADLIARGVIRGCLDAGLEPAQAIAVFRVPGAWEEEGAALLQHYGVTACDRSISIDEAARLAVQALS